jgi:hypothetical protein
MTVKEMKPVRYVRTGFFFCPISGIVENYDLPLNSSTNNAEDSALNGGGDVTW